MEKQVTKEKSWLEKAEWELSELTDKEVENLVRSMFNIREKAPEVNQDKTSTKDK